MAPAAHPARGRLVAAQSGPAEIEAAAANVELACARVAQAQAALDRAELELSYTSVRAGVSGVAEIRSIASIARSRTRSSSR